MSPLDASFLHVEDAVTHMHIGSVAVFEGPVPSYDEIEQMVRGKLGLVPRYRQKVRFVPGGIGRPVWVDDPHFHLGYHLRHSGLASPGGDAELQKLVGRLMSQQLDRTKPLWEMWVVEGLAAGHWALISKVHHCMVDGVAGTDLLALLLDLDREPAPPVADRWVPSAEPSPGSLATHALVDFALSPYEQLRALRATSRRPRQVARSMIDLLGGLAALAGVARPTATTSLIGPIGPHRRWAWGRSTLGDAKVVRSALGGTVNDVVLTAITWGFRELLQSRGEEVTGLVVRTLVPVSVRTGTERGTYNNRVSAIFAELPVHLLDPVEALATICRQMDGLKDSKQAVAGEVLTSLTGFAPAMLLSLGARLGARVATRQRNVHTVTTNVPGPQVPLYATGRRMLEAFPYVPLAGGIQIGVAVFSYDGMLNFGVTGDYDKAPDIDVVCRGIEEGMAAMVKAAAAS